MVGSAKARRSPKPGGLTYAGAGIDRERYDSFVGALGGMLKRTHGPRVIPNPGGFAGLFRLDYNEKIFARNYRDPVLVACADGVGTKIKVARETGVLHTIGIDLVAMNVNDLVVEGAEPLFLLDCLSVHQVDEPQCAAVMQGVVEGCRMAGCALLGGETAEMGDLFQEGDFDLTGFAVGVVDLHRAMSRRRPSPGDIVLGLGSSGLHANGFRLAREIVRRAGLELGRVYPELGADGQGRTPTLGEVLLTPTRIYSGSVVRLDRAYRVKKVVTGMAHVTGGGLAANLARSLGPGVDAVIETGAWEPHAVFRFLQRAGSVGDAEMRRAFNMGIGYCIVVRPTFADAARARLERYGERVHVIGKIVKGRGRVVER